MALLLELVVLPAVVVVFGRTGGGANLDEDVGEDAVVSACRGICSVPGPLQSGNMGVILALQVNGGYILESYGMLAASWMARLLLVLLSWVRMVMSFCF